MKKQYGVIFGIYLFVVCLWTTGCTSVPSVAQDYHVVPTPAGAVYVPSCDEPTWIVGGQEICRFLVTPLPGEQVRVGSITEFSPTLTSQPQLRYTVREDIPPWEPMTQTDQIVPVQKLFVYDAENGQEVRLGDDAGDAFLEARTDHYAIWRYQWNGQGETTRKTGLYALALETGEEIVIAQHPDVDPWYPEVYEQWVVYADGFNNDDKGTINIRVHNLATGEDFLIDHYVPHLQEFNVHPASDYYAISGQRIAWMDSSWKVHVYDLKNQTSYTLDIPSGNSSACDVSISGDIVVWWDKFWHGYDLQQNALFTIPTIPLGWENISVQPMSPVTVRDDQLYWSLAVNEEIYRFTAPIIRNQ